jgi:hypothetical protein
LKSRATRWQDEIHRLEVEYERSNLPKFLQDEAALVHSRWLVR